MRIPSDIVPGAVLLVIAAFYGLTASEFPAGRSGDPGAALFPYILSGALAALSLWIMASAVLTARKSAPETVTPAPSTRPGLYRVLAAIVLTIGFVASFATLGYVIATALYAGLMSLLFRRDTLVIPVLSMAVAVAFIHVFFAIVLNVRLPLGLLG